MRVSNDSMIFFKNIDNLPIELIELIFDYVPKIVKLFLSKQIYLEDH